MKNEGVNEVAPRRQARHLPTAWVAGGLLLFAFVADGGYLGYRAYAWRAALQINPREGTISVGEVIQRLGGPETAARKAWRYRRLPFVPYKEYAIVVLVECGPPAIPCLVALAENRWAGQERLYAISALMRLGPEARAAVPTLERTLTDADFDVRFAAAWALWAVDRNHSEKKILPVVRQGLERKDWTRVRAAEIYWRITGDVDLTLPILAATARDENGDLVRIADGVLSEFGAVAVPALTDALQDERWDVRLWAAKALGEIGPAANAAIPALEKMGASGDHEERRIAESALEEIRRVKE